MKRLSLNPDLCTGCLNCQVVCAQARAGDQDHRAAAIRIELDVLGGAHVQLHCRQCEDALCAQICPEEAIQRDESTGAWVIDRELCRRCGYCVRVCPHGAMFWWDGDRGPVKCDLCGGRPRCVAACRFGALTFREEPRPEEDGS